MIRLAVRRWSVGWMRASVGKVGAVQVGTGLVAVGGVVHGRFVDVVAVGDDRILLFMRASDIQSGITDILRTVRSGRHGGRK